MLEEKITINISDLQELVEFAKSHEGSWVDLSDLVSRRDRYTNGFLTVTPTLAS